jgi:HD-GYP domain-containing protein (c-di-GMP phosphodiesterase class II)
VLRTCERAVLRRDLVTSEGKRLAERGESVDLATLRAIVARCEARTELRLVRTFVAAAVLDGLEAPPLQHLVGSETARANVADVLTEVQFPTAIWRELEITQAEDPARFQHAIWSAIVSARLFSVALGTTVGVARAVAGALVHDLGMRVAADDLRENSDHLTTPEASALREHPLLGALLVAASVGDSPAVHFALLHHQGPLWRPGEPVRPLSGLDVSAVASAFSALVAHRPFRHQPFSPRGAVDQLLEEAALGRFDQRAVHLLIHCMRGGGGRCSGLRLPRAPTGFRPRQNCYGPAAAG